MADGTAKGRLPSKQGGENRGSELPVPSPSCVSVSDCKKRLLPNPFVSGSQLLVLFLLQNITLCCKNVPPFNYSTILATLEILLPVIFSTNCCQYS